MPRSGWLDSAFGWMLSAGIHVVLLLGAALVFIEYLMPVSFSYTDFGLDWGSEDPRIEPRPAPSDYFNDHRAPLEDPVDLADVDGGPDNVPTRPDRGLLMSDRGTPDRLWLDSSHEGSSGTAICNLEGTWSKKTAADAERRQGGVRFGTGVQLCRFTRRLVCGLESVQVQSLVWLARHQNPDGGWSSAGFAFCCDRGSCTGAGDPAFDSGVTSLSLLAFLGAGYTPFSKDQLVDKQDARRTLFAGDAVKKGLQWLVTRQDAEGCVGARGPKFLYNHAIATLALCEAYGMTELAPLRGPAQKAVDFLVAAQNPGAGWRYGVRDGESDTSVTGWAVMALKSAELSGLSFPPSAYVGALAWLDQVSSSKSGVGYHEADSGKVYIPGKNERFDDHPTMSAIGLMSRLFIQKRPRASSLAPAIAADPPSTASGKVDFYYWYYGSLALFQHDGPEGPMWKHWNEPMKKSLLELQKPPKSGCEDGSWDPAGDRWGSEGGRVYATALNTLTFEIYYRYTNVFGGKNPR